MVGEAADGKAGLAECARLAPDVVLVDVQMPDLDGFEVARRLNGPRVVLTSSREAGDYGTRLEDSAIDGFISKGELSAGALADLLA